MRGLRCVSRKGCREKLGPLFTVRRFIFASTPVALKNKLTDRHTSFSVIRVTGELLFNDL